MAVTLAGRRLSDAYRISQAQLATRATVQLLAVWPLLDPAAIDDTLDRWLSAAAPVVNGHHSLSGSLADAYYRTLRTVETPDRDLPDLRAVSAPAQLPAEQVATSLTVAGPLSLKAGATAEAAAARMAAAGTRLALSGGRDRVAQLADADPVVRRVRRITSPRCCAFCAMLATRDQLPPFSGAHWFRAHDNCLCIPEPAWDSGAGQTALASQFAELWQSSTDGVSSAGNGKLNAFRQALEASRR